jgi:ribonuclease G
VDIYINPFLKSFLTKGFLSISFKWMLKYRIRISLIADETISLNEFKVTLAGSDIDITEAVMRGEKIDDLIEAANSVLHEMDSGKPARDNLDYYSKDNGNGSDLPSRPSQSGNNKSQNQRHYQKN